MVVLGTLAETSVSLSLGGETSGLSVLVDRVGDPVDSGVSSDSLVRRAVGESKEVNKVRARFQIKGDRL